MFKTYRDNMQISRKAILLILLVVIACAIVVMRFSNTEGFNLTYSPNIDGNTVVQSNTVASPASVTISSEPITTNAELIKVITAALNGIPDVGADKKVIANVQGRIASVDTPNARTLLSEMGNMQNYAENPRRFLEYMNWFASNYPIDK